MKKTYTGSCHCGAVRFEADIDLSAGTATAWRRSDGTEMEIRGVYRLLRNTTSSLRN